MPKRYISLGYKFLCKPEDQEDIVNLRKAMDSYAESVEREETDIGPHEVFFFYPKLHIRTSTASNESNVDESNRIDKPDGEGKRGDKEETMRPNQLSAGLFLVMMPLFMMCADELAFYQTPAYFYDAWGRAERMLGYVLLTGVSFQRLRVPGDPIPTFESVIGDLHSGFVTGHELELSSWTYDVYQNELFLIISDPRHGTMRMNFDQSEDDEEEIIYALCECMSEWQLIQLPEQPRRKPELELGESAMHVELN